MMNAGCGFSSDTLLIIPCCASKSSGGLPQDAGADPLRSLVPKRAYSSMLQARAGVLAAVKGKPKYLTDKSQKNGLIKEGHDLGGKSSAGLYLKALSRYTGKLYSVPWMKLTVERMLAESSGPKMLILSALYGPLHPDSLIQDYNLMMADAPAQAWALAFPPFLEAYVRQNGIKQIVMYVGSGTSYFTVTKKAVRGLLDNGLLARSVQYHVTNGSTPTTPLQHGLRLLDDLDARPSEGYPRSVGIVENVL